MAARSPVRWSDRALPWCAGALCLAVSGGAALEGQRLQAARESEEAEDLLAEDRAVCLRLGAGPGTDRFSQCAIELSWVRAQERRRVMAESEILP